MKNNQTIVVFFILNLLISFSIKSQTSRIDSLKIIPSNPTTNDSVKVVCYSKFSSGFCALTNDSMDIIAGTFHIYASHNTGTLTFICFSIDTFTVGKLDSGIYQLIYHLSDFITPVDTDTINFIVQEPLGLNFKKSDAPIELFPNPTYHSQTLIINTKSEEEIQIDLINLQGDKLQSVYFGRSIFGENIIKLDISILGPAMYFYEIKFGNKIEHMRFIKQ
jgi:hypothetical protein